MARNPVLHAKSKHIELDLHFIREKVIDGIVNVNYVPSFEEVADVFTKALPVVRFSYLDLKIMHLFLILKIESKCRTQ